MREEFGRRLEAGRDRLPAVLQHWRRFHDLGWIASALAILGLSGLLALASVWLWRGGTGRSSLVETAAPARGLTTAALASGAPSEPQPGPTPGEAVPAARQAEAGSAQSAATPSRPVVPFPAELRDATAVEAAPSAVSKQTSRVAVASAEATLPSGSVSMGASEAVPPAPSSSGAGAGATDAAPANGAAISIEEARRLAARATNLLKAGDIAGARLLLARASSSGEARGAFLLAETYDPKVLARWNVRGIRADPEKAKALYRQAAAAGLVEARGRIEALR